jgi:hypothetical protein
MEKKVENAKMIRQRRFMLVVPLLVLPFMTMMFWALGGGKIQQAEAQTQKQEGFNLKLPDANLKEGKPMDKMSYYDQAKLDSTKFRELVKSDPNYNNIMLSDQDGLLGQNDSFQKAPGKKGLNTSLSGSGGNNDPNAEKIYRKLAELDKELNKPVNTPAAKSVNNPSVNSPGRSSTTVGSADVDRLEQMMQMMSQPDEADPEMQQLNGMLEKILDIQHPDRVQEKLKQTSEARKGQVFIRRRKQCSKAG